MADMWYYTNEGKQMDAVSIKELKRLVKDGVLKPTDMVWKDGMARWIRASSVNDLYPDPTATLDQYFSTGKDDKRTAGAPIPVGAAAGAASSSSVQNAPGKTAAVPTAAQAEVEESRPRVKKRRTPADGDDDDRNSKSGSKEGSKLGIILALLFGGGLLLAGLVVGVIILIVATQAPAPQPRPNGGGPALKVLPADFTKVVKTYTVNVGPNANHTGNVTLRRGIEYQISVPSEPKQPDVDLFVFNRAGQQVASDTDFGPDPVVQFLAQDDGDYRIEVRNLDLGIAVKAVVTVREPGPPPVVVKEEPKEQPLAPDVKTGSDSIRGITLAPGQDHVFKVRVKKDVDASFSVTTHVIKGLPKPQPALNHLFVLKENNETVLASDTLPAGRAQARFMPQVTEIARVRVVNTSKTAPARVSVSYNVGP